MVTGYARRAASPGDVDGYAPTTTKGARPIRELEQVALVVELGLTEGQIGRSRCRDLLQIGAKGESEAGPSLPDGSGAVRCGDGSGR